MLKNSKCCRKSLKKRVLKIKNHILFVVSCLLPKYTSFCRGLKYWQKVRHIILVENYIIYIRYDCELWNASWFYCIFLLFFTKLERCFSTKLSQIVGPINTHILICWHARYDYKLGKFLWVVVFWKLMFFLLNN